MQLAAHGATRKDRHRWRRELREWKPKLATAVDQVAELSRPELARLDAEEQHLGERVAGLHRERDTYARWAELHPEVPRRLDRLSTEIDSLTVAIDGPEMPHGRALGRDAGHAPPAVARDFGLGLGR